MDFVIPGWLILVFAGGLGQLLRALIGIKKAIDNEQYLSGRRTVVTILIAMFIGALAGVISNDWKLAFTAGYAATDGIEGCFKIATHEPKEKK